MRGGRGRGGRSRDASPPGPTASGAGSQRRGRRAFGRGPAAVGRARRRGRGAPGCRWPPAATTRRTPRRRTRGPVDPACGHAAPQPSGRPARCVSGGRAVPGGRVAVGDAGSRRAAYPASGRCRRGDPRARRPLRGPVIDGAPVVPRTGWAKAWPCGGPARPEPYRGQRSGRRPRTRRADRGAARPARPETRTDPSPTWPAATPRTWRRPARRGPRSRCRCRWGCRADGAGPCMWRCRVRR